MPEFQQRASSKAQANHCIFSKGPSSLIVCPPSQNLTRPSKLSKAGSNQKKRQNGTQSKARSCLQVLARLQNKPSKVYAIFSTSQIGTIAKAGTSTKTGNNMSCKVPARDPARFRQEFQQGSSRVPARSHLYWNFRCCAFASRI